MGEFFQEHKRTIAVATLVTVAFLVAYSLITGHYGSVVSKARMDAKNFEAKAKGFSVSAEELRLARTGREQAAQRVTTLTQRLNRVQDDGFELLPTIVDADLHYNRMTDAVRRDQLERCAIANIDADPSLGLPDAFPTTRREIDWYLRGLDVVKQVLDIALKVNSGVLEGGIARIERVEIAPAPKARKDNAPTPLIGKVPVTFVVVGHPLAIGALREALARPVGGKAIALLSGTERSLDQPPQAGPKTVRGADPLDTGRTQATLQVAALEVNSGEAASAGNPAAGN